MRYLITQSLLQSWLYVHSCYPGCEEDAMASFLAKLRKEPEDLSDEKKQNIQNGIDFEAAVYAEARCLNRVPHPKWEKGIQICADFVKGAQFQVRVQRELSVCGMTFLVYGILDALKAGTITDIKFKNKSFGSLDLAGEYFDSPQHPLYFYMVPEAREFQYLVSDGTDIYIEKYTPEECIPAESLVSEFIAFLTASHLLSTYKEYWKTLS